jgi:DNA-binding LacI/PurR family transcriptional regulator
LKKYNIPTVPAYIKHGQFKQKSGYQLTKELLIENEIPTAILAGNDIIALGVIQAIEEFGLSVPNNISVVGFDDISFAALDKIQLTTVFQPKYKIGELCVEILLDKIKNPCNSEFTHKVLEPKLIIRKTCRGI